MSIKICFIFVVVLAISFVHSLPKLSGVTEGNTQLMALMQSFNARAPSLRALQKKDKSGSAESEESIDGYIDMVFDSLFDLEKDSSEEDVDLAFGPEFNPEQFFVRLNDDIDKAFQRKCKKISGRDDTYSRIKAATKELGQCLKRFVKSEEVRTAYTNLNSEEDAYSVFRLWCRKRNVPFKCLDEYIAVDEQCSFPSEIAYTNSIRRIFYGIWDVVCANHGNDFIAMVSGSGRECIMEHLDELKTCQNKELYAIVKGLVVKLIEYETFELKMDAEDCKAFDEVQSCVVSSVENCVDPAPKNYFASIYQVIYNETECSTATPIQVKLLK